MEVRILVLLSIIVNCTPDFSFILLVTWLDCFLFMTAEFGCPRYFTPLAVAASIVLVVSYCMYASFLPLSSPTPPHDHQVSVIEEYSTSYFYSDLYAIHQAAGSASEDMERSSRWEICSSGATSRMQEIWHGMLWTWVYMCAQFRHLCCLRFSWSRWYSLLDFKIINMYFVI